MSRRTVLVALGGVALLGALAGPAAAGPLGADQAGDGRTTVCIGLNNQPGATQDDGICVWAPVEPPHRR